jgi:type II secretory pathway component GspD/PulD (secretin)
MKTATLLAIVASLTFALPVIAQNADTATKAEAPKQSSAYNAETQAKTAQFQIKTFYLTNASTANEANEILVALRNLLPPYVKMFLVSDQNAIVVEATPDQLATAQKMIEELDRPRKTYRLTYTLTDVDGGKRVGTQHFSMVVVTGQRTTLKQGSKVPVATGSYSSGAATTNGTETQFTYLDVGMNFSAQLDEIEHGARLYSKVEQSSLGEDKHIANVLEPVVRQTVIEGTSFLTLNKPLILGSVDILGSTRHIDIEVVMEQVP